MVSSGQKVTLLGETGPPRWYKLRTPAQDSQLSTSPDIPFSVQSSRLALVELLPDPLLGRYRFSAEVRHDGADRLASEAGIYLAYSKYNTSQGVLVHYFYALSFNDLSRSGRHAPRLGLEGNSARFTIQRHVETSPKPSLAMIPCLERIFTPRPHAWRKVAVEVGPGDKIAVFWEDTQVGELSRAALMKIARVLDPIDPLDIDPHFPSRGSLGIYVNEGSASFRELVVEPLVGEN
jgi:serine/threonine-protein kinase